MSVLARLALRAIGAKGQVRPRIGGLFERGSPDPAAETINAATAARPPQAPGDPRSVPMAAMSQGDSPGAASGRAISQAWSAASETRPAVAVQAPPGSQAESDARRHIALGEAGLSGDAASPAAIRPSAAPDLPAPTVEPSIGASVAAAPAARPPTYRPLLPEFSAMDAPPPSVERRAGSAGREEAALHISIGRIEIRGEPERRPPAPAPRPGPQLMSLEDYLAKGRRR